MGFAKRLVFVALNTSDLQESTAFYRDVFGVPLETDNRPGDDPWIAGTARRGVMARGLLSAFCSFPRQAA